MSNYFDHLLLKVTATHLVLVFIMLYIYILIVPPRMLNSSRDITVEMSTEDVQLECFAAGRPTPHISWYRYTYTGQRSG